MIDLGNVYQQINITSVLYNLYKYKFINFDNQHFYKTDNHEAISNTKFTIYILHMNL